MLTRFIDLAVAKPMTCLPTSLDQHCTDADAPYRVMARLEKMVTEEQISVDEFRAALEYVLENA